MLQTDINLKQIKKEFNITINEANRRTKFYFILQELKLESVWNEEETEILEGIKIVWCILKETTKGVEFRLSASGFSNREILNELSFGLDARILHKDFFVENKNTESGLVAFIKKCL